MERNRMGELAITAGLGLAAGALLANPARKLAMQSAEAFTTRDWVEALTLEHRAVSKVFDTLLQTTERQTGKRKSGLAAIDHALTKHAFQEETVIYPALRRVDEDQAQQLFHEHFEVKTFLSELTFVHRTKRSGVARKTARIQTDAGPAHPSGGGRNLPDFPRTHVGGNERAANPAHAYAGVEAGVAFLPAVMAVAR